jgi:hypothetical protein
MKIDRLHHSVPPIADWSSDPAIQRSSDPAIKFTQPAGYLTIRCWSFFTTSRALRVVEQGGVQFGPSPNPLCHESNAS